MVSGSVAQSRQPLLEVCQVDHAFLQILDGLVDKAGDCLDSLLGEATWAHRLLRFQDELLRVGHAQIVVDYAPVCIHLSPFFEAALLREILAEVEGLFVHLNCLVQIPNVIHSEGQGGAQ